MAGEDDLVADAIAGLFGNSGADTGINPTTDLPWGVYPDATSPTGYVLSSTQQPVYKDGSPWNGQTQATKPSSGGSTYNYTTVQSGILGANRYTTAVDATGTVTGYPGATYQLDNLDGSIQILSKGAGANVDPADRNADGIDDSSGLAMGVYKYAGSPTGYAYGSGQPVWPNGAPYTGADAAEEAPKLYSGNKIWDPKQGKFVTAPGYETTASGGTQSISIGGSSRAPTAQETAAMNAQKAAADLAKIQAQSAAQASGYQAASAADIATAKAKADLDRELMLLRFQLENDPNNPELQLKWQQLALQQQQLEMSNRNAYEDRQLKMVDSFRSAVSDVDPAAYRAWLYGGQNMGQGGNIANRLSEGGNALSDAANAGAAALLAKIRTPYQSVYQQIAGLPSSGTSAPVTGGLGTITPGTGTPGAPAPTGTGTGLGTITPTGLRPDGLTEAQAAAAHIAQREQSIAARNAQNADIEARRLVSALPYEPPQQPWEADAAAYNYGMWAAALAPYGTDKLGQAYGGSAQTMDPNMPNYRDPHELAVEQAIASGRMAPPLGNLENDQISRELPVRAVIPGLARGGSVRGPYISGDHPQGKPNPELNIPDGMGGTRVIPLRNMAPQQRRGLMRGLPKFADGTDELGQAWMGGAIDFSALAGLGAVQPEPAPVPVVVPTSTRRRTTTAPVATQPAAPAPVASQPYVAPQPAPVVTTPAPVAAQPYVAPVVTQPVAQPYVAPVAQTVATPVGSTSTASSPAPTASTAAPSVSASPSSASSSTTAPAAGSTTAPTATNLGQIQPNATVQQVVNTPSGAVTAPDPVTAQQIQEIADWRTNQLDPMFASTSPYSLALADAGPTTYQGYLANYQTARGIPQGDFDAEIKRWRLKGLSRDAVLAATGV